MRHPDVGIGRSAVLQARLTPQESARLDAKRGRMSRSAWVRAAIEQWDGPGGSRVVADPIAPVEHEGGERPW